MKITKVTRIVALIQIVLGIIHCSFTPVIMKDIPPEISKVFLMRFLATGMAFIYSCIVMLNDLFYIEGMKDYLDIVTGDKRLMCLQNFSALTKVLPEKDFVRVHRSYVVSLNKIESISNHRIRMGEKLFPISESYQKAFYASLEKFRRIL